MNCKYIFPLAAAALLGFAACHKSDDSTPQPADFKTLETQALADFTDNIALASYQDLSAAAAEFDSRIVALNANATEASLSDARASWKSMREVWERCEGFLFGPVEDADYDPQMDTWPTDYVQMDSLLASGNALESNDIKQLTLSLRGYHPLEYMLFGDHGSRRADSLTARQKKYMGSLVGDVKGLCDGLYASWSSDGFAQQVRSAGSGSTKYKTKKEAFLAIVNAMTDICGEVGDGKMKEPFEAQDPQLVESPYSGNSLTDFRNNLIGLQQVYLGKYKKQGTGLSALVAAKNLSLDNRIKEDITAAINSFDLITMPYEEAIVKQRVEVQRVMNTISDLSFTLDNELKSFVQQYITD